MRANGAIGQPSKRNVVTVDERSLRLLTKVNCPEPSPRAKTHYVVLLLFGFVRVGCPLAKKKRVAVIFRQLAFINV
jgi:hypothetical protein